MVLQSDFARLGRLDPPTVTVLPRFGPRYKLVPEIEAEPPAELSNGERERALLGTIHNGPASELPPCNLRLDTIQSPIIKSLKIGKWEGGGKRWYEGKGGGREREL